MFISFKEKLKNWTKKFSKLDEDSSEKEIDEKSEKRAQEKAKEKADKKAEKEFKKNIKKLDKKDREKSNKKEESKKVEKEEDGKKEIDMPLKFNEGIQKYEPDLEKLEEVAKELGGEEKDTKQNKDKGRLKDEEGLKSEEILKEEKERGRFFGLKNFAQKKIKISEKEFDVYKEELEMLLLENNVAFEVTEKIIELLREKIIGREFLKKEAEQEINELFKEIIEEILIEPVDIIEEINKKKRGEKNEPYVILFCGINGGGKTTSLAKVSEMLKKEKISSVMAAGDTFRAASIEQIKKHGDRLSVPVIFHDYGTDPASVGFDAISYAKKNKIDCVLIDTAGRMHTDKNLLREIEKISKVCHPDLKIFVGESITGNDVIEQAKSFNWYVNIDGSILTKADIDEKGGTALSIGFITKKPILFLGTGQEYDKIEPFDKKEFIKKLGL